MDLSGAFVLSAHSKTVSDCSFVYKPLASPASCWCGGLNKVINPSPAVGVNVVDVAHSSGVNGTSGRTRKWFYRGEVAGR